MSRPGLGQSARAASEKDGPIIANASNRILQTDGILCREVILIIPDCRAAAIRNP